MATTTATVAIYLVLVVIGSTMTKRDDDDLICGCRSTRRPLINHLRGPRDCIWGYQPYIFGTTHTCLVLVIRDVSNNRSDVSLKGGRQREIELSDLIEARVRPRGRMHLLSK